MNYRQTSRIESLLLADFVDAATAFSPALFSLPTLFLFPSLESVALVILGAILGSMFFTFLCTLEDINRQRECLSGFLQPFSKCTFVEYQVKDFSTTDSLLLQETETLHASFFGYYGRLNLRRKIRVYAVKRGQSSIVPAQLVAYESFFRTPSFIFVRDEPERITPLGKFFIYHEVGHSSWQNCVSRRFTRIGWKFFLLPFFWAILNLQPQPLAYCLLGIYALLLAIAYPLFRYLLHHYTRVMEEAGADLFAIACLSQEERFKLTQHLVRVGELPNDQSLTSEQNSGRYDLLLRHLKEVESPPIIMIHSETASRYLFVLGILLPVMGLLSRAPSMTLLCFSAVVIVVFFGIMILQTAQKESLVEESQRIILKTDQLSNS